MINKISTYQWIVAAATMSLLFLGGIQMNWISKVNLLEEKEVDRSLKSVAPQIALRLEADSLFSTAQIIAGEELINMDFVSYTIDSMMLERGFDQKYYYAIFQKKEKGIYKSNTTEFEKELKNSKYKFCLSSVTTIQILNDSLDGKKSDYTFLREVDGVKVPKAESPEANYLWVSIFIPNFSVFSRKELWGLYALTFILMSILIGLFAYTLRALTKQKKLSEIKDDFFNNMTHEFKTPLSSIRLAAKVLKQKNVDKNKEEIYLNLIENESKKLEGQVDKVLQLSSIESHQMVLEKEQLNLHQAIEEVVLRLKLIIEQKEATVNLSLDLKDHFIKGDFSHISNCIYNLVENALKYSGANPQITISTLEENGHKIISVKDQGKGIREEYRTEIFDRFYRAQKNDQYQGKGFGIGLSYVKTIIEAHDGIVFLNQKYEKGCDFVIQF